MPECLCLILQKAGDGLDRFASLEFDCEGMLCQRDARLFLIRAQGRPENGLKTSRFRLMSHVTTREVEEGDEADEELIARGDVCVCG